MVLKLHKPGPRDREKGRSSLLTHPLASDRGCAVNSACRATQSTPGECGAEHKEIAESSASSPGCLIHNCPGPPTHTHTHCAHLRQSGRKSVHRPALARLPVSSVQPERSGKFLKRYRRLPEASCGPNCSAGDCCRDSRLVPGGLGFAGKTEWRSCVTTAAVASVSTPRPTRTVRRSVAGRQPSPGRPLPTLGLLHLASPRAVPGSLSGLSPSLGAQGRALRYPRRPSFLSGHSLHFLNSRLSRPGLHCHRRDSWA